MFSASSFLTTLLLYHKHKGLSSVFFIFLRILICVDFAEISAFYNVFGERWNMLPEKL